MTDFITTAPDNLTRDNFGWDDVRALAHSEMSRASYLPTSAEYRKAVKAAGWLDGEILDPGAAEVAVAWTPRVICISCRGTKGWMDLLRDAQSAVRRPFALLPEGRMAMGFKRHVNEVRSVLVCKVRLLLEAFPQARIVINGHSLGGGMVPGINLALLTESKEDLNPETASRWLPRCAYVLEGPRVFNKKGAGWYHRHVVSRVPHVSIVHVDAGVADIVPRLPPKWLGYDDHLRRSIVTGDRVFEGWDVWKQYLDENPGPMPKWAKLTRLAVSINIHGMDDLIDTLRGRIKSRSCR